MPTNTRSEQARINGAKSKGPKTQLGKFIASTNLRNGLHAAKSYALKLENSSQYDGQLSAYIRRYQPQDAVELNLVRELCCVDWQIHRFKAYSTAVLNHQIDVNDTTYQATDIRVPDDLRGVLAVDFVNKSSNVIIFLANQERQLTQQRLAVLRALSETRKIAPVFVPGFYLSESEEFNGKLDSKHEPEPPSPFQETA